MKIASELESLVYRVVASGAHQRQPPPRSLMPACVALVKLGIFGGAEDWIERIVVLVDKVRQVASVDSQAVSSVSWYDVASQANELLRLLKEVPLFCSRLLIH